jgi:hypothetical protein
LLKVQPAGADNAYEDQKQLQNKELKNARKDQWEIAKG